MLYGSLADYQRDDLLKPAIFWLRQTTKDDQAELLREIRQCFEQWKRSIADDKGQVESFAVARSLKALYLGKGTMVPGSQALPWHCGGPFVSNQIDLAFKLWLDSYSPFEVVLDKHGFCKVFAMCSLMVDDLNAHARSLIRVNGFLTERLAEFADIVARMAEEHIQTATRRRRQDEGLRQARDESSRKRKERARQLHEQIQKMAFEYFQARPGDGVDDAVRHLKVRVPLGSSTIKKKIKGVRAQALRALNTRGSAR